MKYDALISRLKEAGNYRKTPDGDLSPALTDFSSNDYLGLATRDDIRERFLSGAAARHSKLTSSASRLLATKQTVYADLEHRISSLYGNGRRTVLFNSGYHANTGLIPALADRDTLIVSDRLVHASILDGILLSRARHLRFAHNDFNSLVNILESHRNDFSRIIVIVESVYSMDGDRADIGHLTDIRRHFPEMLLYVDEAHAFGVEGPMGLGLSAALGHDSAYVDVIVGTLGKAAASTGAFAVMSPLLRDVAVNRARSFIFSTALPPLNTEWSALMIDTLTGMDTERDHLHHLGTRLARRLAGLPGSAPEGFTSHIYPFIVGDADRTIEMSHSLRSLGMLVLPIRTPTVPTGTERLRISLSAAHTTDDIDRLADALTVALRSNPDCL